MGRAFSEGYRVIGYDIEAHDCRAPDVDATADGSKGTSVDPRLDAGMRGKPGTRTQAGAAMHKATELCLEADPRDIRSIAAPTTR